MTQGAYGQRPGQSAELFQSRNKLGYAYVLTPSGMAEKADITRRFLGRKQKQCEALKLKIDAHKFEVKKL